MTSPQRQTYTPSMFLRCNRKDCGAIVAKEHAPVIDGKRVCSVCGHRSLAEIKAPAAGS